MFRRQNSETAKRTCDPDVEVVDSIIGQSVVSSRAGLGLSQKQQDQIESPLPRWWGNQGRENNSKLESWMNSCTCEWYYHNINMSGHCCYYATCMQGLIQIVTVLKTIE